MKNETIPLLSEIILDAFFSWPFAQRPQIIKQIQNNVSDNIKNNNNNGKQEEEAEDVQDQNPTLGLFQEIFSLTEDAKSMLFKHGVDTLQVDDSFMFYLPQLSRLILSDCVDITDSALQIISHLGHATIEQLNLSYCSSITDEGLLNLNLPNLIKVDFSGLYHITTKNMGTFLKKHPKLNDLELAECISLTFDILEILFCFPLTSISLSDCSFEWSVVPEMKEKLPKNDKIKSIVLRHTKISDEGLDLVTYCLKNLHILDLSWCDNLTRFEFCLPNLFALNLWGVKAFSDDHILNVSQKNPKISSLTICDCPQISEKGVLNLLVGLKKLDNLWLWGCTGIGPAAIQLLLKHIGPNLNQLCLAGCTRIDDFALREMSCCKKLKHYNLDSCSITDAALKDLGTPDVSTINLRRCQELNSDKIEEVLQRCPNLTSLNLSETRSQKLISRMNLFAFTPKLLSLDLSKVSIEGEIAQGICSKDNLFLHNIMSLKLDDCGLRDENLTAIFENCHKLSFFSANFNQKLTDAPFASLTKKNGSLTYLSFGGCGQSMMI